MDQEDGFGLPLYFRPAYEVILGEFYKSAQSQTRRISQSIGILTDDEVAFLKTHDTLRFDTER